MNASSIRYTLTLLLALAASATPLQTAQADGIPFGVRAGVIEARLHGSIDELVPNYRTGFTAGFWLRTPLGGPWSVQPELHIIQKGGKGDFEIADIPTRVNFSFTYFEAPVLLHFALPTKGAWSPYLVLGPGVAYRVDEKLEVDADLERIFTTTRSSPQSLRFANIFEGVDTLDGSDLNDWDIVAIGGAGLAVGRGRARVVADLRYERGFVNVHRTVDDWSKHGGFVATLGIEVR